MIKQLIQHPFMSSKALAENSAEEFIDAMLRFELALLSAQEKHGLCPEGTSKKIEQYVSGSNKIDVEEITSGVGSGGNAAIPFVKVARARLPEELKPYWHQGATSQDLVDTALMLLLKRRITSVDQLLRLCREDGIRLAQRHKETVMIGRTLLQQALPTTFGVRAIQWTVALEQARRRLQSSAVDGLALQFGGAVGVHSGLGNTGMDLMAEMANTLGLTNPVIPWHTNRQSVHALATAMDSVACAAEKMAQDVALLSQSEVGEVSEPAKPGMGESSSMPHKRNPVRCALVRAACHQLHGHTQVIINNSSQPLERSLGEWHAEWSSLTDSSQLLEGALEQIQTLLSGLEVHPEKMQRNLEATGGGIMAESVARHLSPIIGSDEAKRVSREAAETSRLSETPYADVLMQMSELKGVVDKNEVEAAAAPQSYIGSAHRQLETAIAWLNASE